jgi:hypothetical protein
MIARSAPILAKPSAVARPMPALPPVTSTVLPVIGPALCLCETLAAAVLLFRSLSPDVLSGRSRGDAFLVDLMGDLLR